MRHAAWLSCAAYLVAGCGQGETTLRGDGPRSDVAEAPIGEGLVGPICPDCIELGGESSDFDGGQDPCAQFIRTLALTDAEATAAGFDVRAYRQRLERSFEAPLRWADLTFTSALPRATPISGYQAVTRAHGSITALGVDRTFFDVATCDAGRQCQSAYADVRLDCSHFDAKEVYRLAARVVFATDDGALDATLDGFVQLRLDGPPALAGATPRTALTFGSVTSIRDVQGTLRVEPPPSATRGSVSLYLALLDRFVRGRLELNFTNGWRELAGVPVAPLDDRPLVAALQDDGCPFDVPPVPVSEASAVLGGQTPADALDALRSRIAGTDPRAAWTHLGTDTRFDVAIDDVDHACVAPIVVLEPGAVPGRGQLLNVPIRLSSTDGRLDWPALATYQLGDASTHLPHRLSFQQEFTPASPRWHEAFGGIELARHTERILLRFGARYPVAGDDAGPADTTASAVIEIFEQSGCPGNDLECQQEQADTYSAACLVAPPGGSCRPELAAPSAMHD